MATGNLGYMQFQFQSGDRVQNRSLQGPSESPNYGKYGHITSTNGYENWVRYDDGELGHGLSENYILIKRTVDEGCGCPNPETPLKELSRKQSFMNKLSTAAKKLLSADIRSQIKAGFRYDNLELTGKGTVELMSILADKFSAELTAVADEQIAEESK